MYNIYNTYIEFERKYLNTNKTLKFKMKRYVFIFTALTIAVNV